jgi:hypothetical protein
MMQLRRDNHRDIAEFGGGFDVPFAHDIYLSFLDSQMTSY